MEKKIIDGKEWVCFSMEEKKQFQQLKEHAKQGKLTQEELEKLAAGTVPNTKELCRGL